MGAHGPNQSRHEFAEGYFLEGPFNELGGRSLSAARR